MSNTPFSQSFLVFWQAKIFNLSVCSLERRKDHQSVRPEAGAPDPPYFAAARRVQRSALLPFALLYPPGAHHRH